MIKLTLISASYFNNQMQGFNFDRIASVKGVSSMKTSIQLLFALTFLLGSSLLLAEEIDGVASIAEPEQTELAEETEGLEPEIPELEIPELNDDPEIPESESPELTDDQEIPEHEPATAEPPEAQHIDEEPFETVTDPADPVPERDQMSFNLMVHPIFNPEQAELVYLPLIAYLNEATPHHFQLQTARDFHRYWAEIRRGTTPDLVLEDAHLTALRIRDFGYTPLVKAEEPATFSLLTSGMNMDADLIDFVGRPVSSMPAPSLGYLILTSWYDNPMQQPVIQSNASSWLDAVEIVFSMEAEAAIVPHNLVARYVNMENVQTSEEFPHATISANPDVPEHVQRDIVDALTVLHDDPDHFQALHELDIDRFVPADAIEYEGLERWLRQVFTFR